MAFKYNIDFAKFTNIREVWGLAENAVEVRTMSGKHLRVVAAANIKSGASPAFFAHYDIERELDWGAVPVKVWSSADYPDAVGRTADECLDEGLFWVNSKDSEE